MAVTCGCPVNKAGDIRCHACGEYVNVRCWNCRTPRGEGTCPNPVGPAAPTQEDAHDSQAEPVSTRRGLDLPHLAFDTGSVRRVGYIGASSRSESTHCKCAERRAAREDGGWR